MPLVPPTPYVIEEEHHTHFNPNMVTLLRPHPTMDRTIILFIDKSKAGIKSKADAIAKDFGKDFVKRDEYVDKDKPDKLSDVHVNRNTVSVLRSDADQSRTQVLFSDGSKTIVNGTPSDTAKALGDDFIGFDELIDGSDATPVTYVNRKLVKCITQEVTATDPPTVIHCTGSVELWGKQTLWAVRVKPALAKVFEKLNHA